MDSVYPTAGDWRGRVPALSNDLSCGGVSFFCARRFQRGDLVQIVIPITSQPLVLTAKVLRERPSGEPVPLFAAEFVELLHEEEMMVREAVFSLPPRLSSSRPRRGCGERIRPPP